MKKCYNCGDIKENGAFARRGNGLQSQCRECHKIYRQEHYAKNKSKYVAKAKNWKQDRKAILRNIVLDHFAEHPCIDCGEKDITVLEFDHVRGEKKFAISVGVHTWSVAPDVLLEEIAKCEVRCANCHRRKTSAQFGYWS